MARKKTITRDQILNATYEIIRTEGFSGFTARNIASKMKCSTQPIYLEFRNMTDLKCEILKKIQLILNERLFSNQPTAQTLVGANLNYIHLAADEPILFRTLFLEGHDGAETTEDFIRQGLLRVMAVDTVFNGVSELEKQRICTEIWVIATGIACLRSGRMIGHSDEDVSNFLAVMIQRLLED